MVFVNVDYLTEKVNIYWKSVLRNWDAPQIEKFLFCMLIFCNKNIVFHKYER